MIESRLSRAIGGRVEIGDLTVQPLDAIVYLHDLAVYAPAAAEPCVEAERVRADLQWLPLLQRTLRLREVVLENGKIDLALTPDGQLAIAGLSPPDSAAAMPSGWTFSLERIGLRETRLGGSAPTAPFPDVVVQSADFSGMVRRAAVFGRANNLQLEAAVGRGRLRVYGRLEPREAGLSIDARALLTGVSLKQVLTPIAAQQPTRLTGTISGKLHWRREPKRRDRISGRVILRRAALRLPGTDGPRFSVRRAVGEIAAVDLSRRSIAVDALTLKEAKLTLRTDSSVSQPLAAVLGPAAQAGASTPWSWSIKQFETAGALLRIAGGEQPIEMRAHVAGENIGNAAYWSPLRATLEYGDVAAAFDGTLRLGGAPVLEGRLTADALDFPTLARSFDMAWADLVQKGTGSLDLTAGFDPSEDAPFFAHGGVAISDLAISGLDVGGATLTAARADLELAGFAPSEWGTRIELTRATFHEPVLFLMRGHDGRLMPPGAVQAPAIAFGEVRFENGKATFVDLMPDPRVAWRISHLTGKAGRLILTQPAVDTFDVRGVDHVLGPFEIASSRRDGALAFQLRAMKVPLAATTPYMEQLGIPYRFDSGFGSVTAEGSIKGTDWSTTSTWVLQAPVFAETDALQRALGMPVPEALARLRDESGGVTLRLPLSSLGGATHAEQFVAGFRQSLAAAEKSEQIAAFSAVSVVFTPGSAELSDAARRELAALADLLRSHGDVIAELSASASRADRRWIAEQDLRSRLEQGAGVGGVLRALGIRRSRDRIRNALAERGRGGAGRLDAKDGAELEKLLAESPPVGEFRLDQLREARLSRVVEFLTRAGGVDSQLLRARREATASGIGLAAVRAEISVLPKPAEEREIEPPARIE